MVPALADPDIDLLPQAPKSYRRRLSLCSLPVPKQSEGSLGSVISSAQSANGRTSQSAHRSSCFLRRQCLCCPSLSFFCRHEISLLPIYGEQIGHHLAGYGEGGPVTVSFLHLFFMNQGQLVALSRRQLRSFHQHVLDMLVALFGKRHSHHLVGRAFFFSAKSAVADGLLDGPETRDISDLQCPRQGSDWPNVRDRSESLDAIGQDRIALEATDQGILTRMQHCVNGVWRWNVLATKRSVPSVSIVRLSPRTDWWRAGSRQRGQ